MMLRRLFDDVVSVARPGSSERFVQVLLRHAKPGLRRGDLHA